MMLPVAVMQPLRTSRPCALEVIVLPVMLVMLPLPGSTRMPMLLPVTVTPVMVTLLAPGLHVDARAARGRDGQTPLMRGAAGRAGDDHRTQHAAGAVEDRRRIGQAHGTGRCPRLPLTVKVP